MEEGVKPFTGLSHGKRPRSSQSSSACAIAVELRGGLARRVLEQHCSQGTPFGAIARAVSIIIGGSADRARLRHFESREYARCIEPEGGQPSL